MANFTRNFFHAIACNQTIKQATTITNRQRTLWNIIDTVNKAGKRTHKNSFQIIATHTHTHTPTYKAYLWIFIFLHCSRLHFCSQEITNNYSLPLVIQVISLFAILCHLLTFKLDFRSVLFDISGISFRFLFLAFCVVEALHKSFN